MGPLRSSSSIDQSAAFALFEALRHAQGLAASPDGRCRATFMRAADSAAAGLAWANAGDDALELRWGEAPAPLGDRLWVAATTDERGHSLAVYLRRDRPAIQVHFTGPSFSGRGDGRFHLRERVTFSSHDGLHRERESLIRQLANTWRLPMEGPWLQIGCWDALEGCWDADAPRRLLASALILEAARNLDPEWLSS